MPYGQRIDAFPVGSSAFAAVFDPVQDAEAAFAAQVFAPAQDAAAAFAADAAEQRRAFFAVRPAFAAHSHSAFAVASDSLDDCSPLRAASVSIAPTA